MSEWIKDRANVIRAAELEKKNERDRQTEAANTLKAKVEPFWNDLVRLLQESVKDFNGEFPEAERRIDQFERPSASVIVIRRTVYPSVLVKATLNNGSNSVNYSIGRTQRKGTEPVETDGSFPVSLLDGEVRYSSGGITQHEDVAKLLLEPFFHF